MVRTHINSTWKIDKLTLKSNKPDNNVKQAILETL